MKPALLVIDVQKKFFGGNARLAEELREASEYINAAIDLFRKKGFPVVCIQHTDPDNDLVAGQPGFDVPEILKILPGDLHIHKTYSNSFTKTGLAEKLRGLGADTIVVTGFAAEYCVLAAARGAEDHDFTAVILRDSIIGGRPGNAKLIESICNIVSYDALEKFLE
ncbi:MAG: cysteine hydrolase [Anaerolineales bacterium]|nr:cysteine hydrolase [Anaerolineales bacterium]